MPRHILGIAAALFALPLADGSAQVPFGDRPSITVTAFEYATVASQITGDERTRRRMERSGVRDGAAFAEALGMGAADLVVEQLVASDRFRVFERKQLDEVRREQQLRADADDEIARARYIVTGSVTRLGLNNKELGGIGGALGIGALGRLGAIGGKYSSTTVHLTARVVDSRTGEIIGSFTGEGVSNKRWGVTAFGLGPGGFGGAKVLDSNFRETAVGEAATRAAAAIADQVVALRASRLRP